MLPVQSIVLSSSCCTLSQASALLDSFLRSDACSDSFARDYVSNVAQALHDSMCRRGGLELGHLPTGVDVRQTGPSSPQSKLRTHGKNCSRSSLGPTDKERGLPAAEDVGQDALDMAFGTALPGTRGASVGNPKRKGRFAGENVREAVPPSSPSETEAAAYINYNRKKRAKEKHERETSYHDADEQKVGDRRKRKEERETETENAVTEDTAPDRKRRKKKKQRTLMEDMKSNDNRGSPVSWSVDENLGEKAAYKADKKAELSRRLEETAKKKKTKKEHHELIWQALSG